MPVANQILMRLKSLLALFIFVFISSQLSMGYANPMASSTPVSTPQCNAFTFDATASYDPDNENLAYYWDFGDGHTSTDSVIEHIYKTSGIYNVVLSVTDNSGQQCSTATTSRKVKVNIPPFANFSGADMVCQNQPINFDASASYANTEEGKLSYNWDFGDNTSVSDKKTVKKTYNKAGTYKVTLKVQDNAATQCATASAENIVYVNAPPVADAGEEIILRCIEDGEDMLVEFDASNTTDANSDPLTYIWDFGDGFTANGVKTSHRFSEINNYDVKLIVNDGTQIGCATGIDFVTVRFSKAPKAEAGPDTFVCPGDSVEFDGSQSYSFKPGTLSAKWDFGDGQTHQGLKVNHSYSEPGTYQASLTVQNELNSMCSPSTDTRKITVNARPSVTIQSVKKACSGKTVHFDATSATDKDGDKLEYYWTFGDGTISRGGPKVSHEYFQGGNYQVSVIVDDGKGTACSTATGKTEIAINTPPVADPGPNLSCCTEKLVEFDASNSSDLDGDTLKYTWEFGDGHTKEGAIVNHTYSKSGNYNVQLTVDDMSGTSCSKTTAGYVASVNAGPVPVINIR